LVLGAIHGPTHFTETDQSFLKIITDLIARSIERALKESEKVLSRETEQVTQMRAEALAVLSHEMRTPLAAIKGYSTALLLEEVQWSDEKQKEFLGFIDEECDNLQVMVTDILDSSLIDIGQFTLEYQPIRLEKIAAETAEDMQRRSDLHKLVVDFPKDFPIVDADPLRIRQIIRNIIDNAIKYSPDGGLIVIRGEVRPSYVVVSISDQGVGISPEDLIPLFDKYFRVKSPTGFYVPGTGLGLPVARALVEEHKGRIWAESKVGEGTTLSFSIPRIQADKPYTQS
jgi:signal transduction histidine kinase